MQQKFSDEVMNQLGKVKVALPADVFVGRVPQYGPRRTYDAVLRYLLETHPESIKILGKEQGNETGSN